MYHIFNQNTVPVIIASFEEEKQRMHKSTGVSYELRSGKTTTDCVCIFPVLVFETFSKFL